MDIASTPLPESGCDAMTAERLTLTLHYQRPLTIDAALWRPKRRGPVPLIIALDFLGPAGLLPDRAFPLDPRARVCVPRHLAPEPEGHPLTETLRGCTAHRFPLEAIAAAGAGLLMSCYGSWVPDDPVAWRRSGFGALARTGALSLWASAYHRLTDAALALPGIDPAGLALSGHSRLGKAALWAGARDTRAAAVFANASGAAGAALSAHPAGESLRALAAAYPHWLSPDRQASAAFDQHWLLALIAPRGLHLGQAADDAWADPEGTAEALRRAQPAWDRGAPSLQCRPGQHDLTAEDWAGFLARWPEPARR